MFRFAVVRQPVRKQVAFTLIEIMTVIAIMGILAALVIRTISTSRVKARDVIRKTNARHLVSALAQYSIDNNGSYPVKNVGGGIDITSANLSNLTPNYLIANSSVFTHDKNAKYISNQSGSYFAQAWELENTTEAIASTGPGIYLTNSAGAAGVTTGGITHGSALNFTSDTTIIFPNTAAYNTRPFSVSLWLNPIDFAATRTVISKYNGANGWQIQIGSGANAGKVIANLYVASVSVASVTSTISLTTGSWNHIGLTFTGSTIANGLGLYVNTTGTADAQATASNQDPNNTVVDMNLSANLNGFRGLIDDIRLYNAPLPGAALAAIRDSSGNKLGQYGSNGETSLVGGWRLDEGTGTTLNDVIGETNPQLIVGVGPNNVTTGIGTATWAIGEVPLGLAWNNGSLTGRSFVSYGPD